MVNPEASSNDLSWQMNKSLKTYFSNARQYLLPVRRKFAGTDKEPPVNRQFPPVHVSDVVVHRNIRPRMRAPILFQVNKWRLITPPARRAWRSYKFASLGFSGVFFSVSEVGLRCRSWVIPLAPSCMSPSKHGGICQQNMHFIAVSSDSRPPNPKCLTAIIVFDIWAQSLILQQGMVSAQFWGKILHFVFIQFMWNIGVLRIRIWRILLNWRPHLNVKNNYWCQAFRI